jgi:NADH-quinone oxidoreductase subunit F
MTDLNQVIFSNINGQDPWSIQAYLSSGGYQTWKSILTDQINKHSPEKIIDAVSKSGLRGRGGAGFPTGKKWSFMPETSQQKYIVCNSDESEPGTCHDRDILKYNPHALIEGMAIAGFATGATVGYNYVRGEFMIECFPRIEQALHEAYELKLLGTNILDSGINFNLHKIYIIF